MMRHIRAWLADTRGASIAAFALAIPVLVGSVGMGVDMSRAYMAKKYLAAALDASALATANSSGDDAALEARMHAYFNKNFSTAADMHLVEVDMSTTPDNLKMWASAYVDTTFLRVLNKSRIDIYAETTVKRELRGIEVVLVLDNTGSMAGSNITALRTAATNFVNIMFDRVVDPRHIKIGIVPYSAAVNVGSIAPSIVSSPVVPPATQSGYPTLAYTGTDGTGWKGCVIERAYPHDVDDTGIAAGGNWAALWWPHDNSDNRWNPAQGGSLNTTVSSCNSMRTPNLGCPTPITPLTSTKSVLTSAINAIQPWCRGGTIGGVGMAWGWRVLSPDAPFTEGAAYNDKKWRKVAIMMTDGDNNMYKESGSTHGSDWGAYKRLEMNVLGTTNANTAKTKLNERFEETCGKMKAKGKDIIIYAITFTSGINATTKGYYKRCATDTSKYYDAPTQQDLIKVFESIARELSNLHIQK